MDEYRTTAEAAYAIALASDPAVRVLQTVANPEVVRMAWMLGYVKGRCDGLVAAYDVIQEARAA